MQTPLEREIRQNLVEYLAGAIALEQFEDEFVSRTWSARGDAEPSLARLIGAVELALAEYTSGHWDEAELRALLTDAAQDVSFVLGAPPAPAIRTEAAGKTEEIPFDTLGSATTRHLDLVL